MTFTRNKLATDAPPIVEVSGDLINWTSGAVATPELPVVGLSDDIERVTVRDAMPAAQAARRFMRVRIAR